MQVANAISRQPFLRGIIAPEIWGVWVMLEEDISSLREKECYMRKWSSQTASSTLPEAYRESG